MRKRYIILILLLVIIFVGCSSKTDKKIINDSQIVSVESPKDEVIPVVVKVRIIDETTLSKLKSEGLEINKTIDDKVYGKVVVGKVNKSQVKALSGEVKESISEREYKSEVLNEIVILVRPEFKQSPNELKYITTDQVILDEQREKAGIIVGPIIEDQLKERVQKEEFVPVAIHFRIEAWNKSTQYIEEIKALLGNKIKIETSGNAGITGYLTKEGLEKLKDKDYIIRIGTRLP